MLLAFAGAVLCFHVSELGLQLLYNPKDVSARSLLITKEYVVAMACAVLEYSIEWALFPQFKASLWPMHLPGAFLVVGGELLRKAAICGAGHNFTHDIQTSRKSSHSLVTTGVYKVVRHPSYLGFFLWSIGTQLLLANPLCAIAFALVVWRFFARRIPYEEFFLEKFFGTNYTQYMSVTPSGIPFIP